MSIYISKPGEWFDAYSAVQLIDDYRPAINAGLFFGKHNGQDDEEVCSFDEFIIVETQSEVESYVSGIR